MNQFINFMNMKTYNISLITILVISILFIKTVNSQDVRFSQPFTVPLNINPATMGMYEDARFMLNSRSQFADIYRTYAFNGFYPVYYDAQTKNKLDIGISMIMDEAGAFRDINPLLAISYKLQLSDNNYLTGAISGGVFQKTLNATGLTFDDQYVVGEFNASNPTDEIISPENIIFPDINFGLLWNYRIDEKSETFKNFKEAFAGISVFHANEPNESFTGEIGVLPRRFSYHAGIVLTADNRIDVSPNIISNYQNGNNDNAIGLYLYYNINKTQRLVLGSWYRDNDAIALLFKIDFFNFELGYAYDIPNSDLGRTLNGMHTHEISLLYKLEVKSLKSPRPDLKSAR